MRKINELENATLKVLKENKSARSDDMLLYLLVCEELKPYPIPDREVGAFYFATVMTCYVELGLPHMEAVIRARNKIQLAMPELLGERSPKYLVKDELDNYELNEEGEEKLLKTIFESDC